MLSVTVKTVKQQTVKIDIEGTATSLDLKGKIQESLGVEYPVECQKLIFKGKILKDTDIIGEIGLIEASFVVVMVSKPKASPVPAPAPAPAPQVAPPSPAATPEGVATPPTPSDLPEGASSAPQQSVDAMIDSLMEMTGNSVPRSMVADVLQRSNNNVGLAGAVLSGGAEDLMQMGSEMEASQPAQENLGFLRLQPQFHQLRSVLQANPGALPDILVEIQQNNPSLFQLINNNRAEFMALINSPESGPSATTGQAPTGQAPTGQTPTGQGAPSGGGGLQISVTAEEKQAIERLKELGFPDHMVIQAYFACEKNEDMAANLLLSDTQPDD